MNTVSMKEFAKKRLHENFWPMVLAALLLMVVTGISSSATGVKFEINFTGLPDGSQDMQVDRNVNPFLILLSLAITFFVANPLRVGVCHFFRANLYQNAKIEDVQRCLTGYTDNVLTMGVMTLITSVASLFCVVPGIIVGLGFTLVPYIQAETPGLSITDTLTISWNKMKGHKMELFTLYLSFIGWILLSVLTCGLLGVFHVTPYMQQTIAAYADTLLREQPMNTFEGTNGPAQNVGM